MITTDERFDAKWTPEPTSGCWLWTAHLLRGGYGSFRNGEKMVAHRYSWERVNGRRVADGMVLDHVCRNRACVNPEHLREVTPRENVLEPRSLSPSKINATKTHCRAGHPLDESRVCAPCTRETRRRWRAANVEKARQQCRDSYHRNKNIL